jgi:hypothetical protein
MWLCLPSFCELALIANRYKSAHIYWHVSLLPFPDGEKLSLYHKLQFRKITFCRCGCMRDRWTKFNATMKHWLNYIRNLFSLHNFFSDTYINCSRIYMYYLVLSLDYVSIYLALPTRAGSPQQHNYANYCGPFLPNSPCQLSLWEETGVPGGNPRLSAERILVPRALLTRGATRGSGQIHNRIP